MVSFSLWLAEVQIVGEKERKISPVGAHESRMYMNNTISEFIENGAADLDAFQLTNQHIVLALLLFLSEMMREVIC